MSTTDQISTAVTCIKWCTLPDQTHYLAVGTDAGVHIYNTRDSTNRFWTGATCRAASLSWNANRQWLTVGFYNGHIYNINFGSPTCLWVAAYMIHQQEVFGLAWNDAGPCLASGSKDTTVVCLWDASEFDSRSSTSGIHIQSPRLVLKGHTTAVKSIAWCPYSNNVLATGGGSYDGTIKLWDTTTQPKRDAMRLRL